MSFGSPATPDRVPLKKLKARVKRTKTPWLSDCLCWGSGDGTFTPGRLPMPAPYSAARRTAEKIRQVQDYRAVPIWVENGGPDAGKLSGDALGERKMAVWAFAAGPGGVRPCAGGRATL